MQPWHTYAAALLSGAGVLSTLPSKLVKLGVKSADQAVAFLEDDTEGTVEMLYPEEEVSEANMTDLKKAIDGLRGTAFAGKRRRHDIDPRTKDLLDIMEDEKAKRAEDMAKGYVPHPSTLSLDSVEPQVEGVGLGRPFPRRRRHWKCTDTYHRFHRQSFGGAAYEVHVFELCFEKDMTSGAAGCVFASATATTLRP